MYSLSNSYNLNSHDCCLVLYNNNILFDIFSLLQEEDHQKHQPMRRNMKEYHKRKCIMKEHHKKGDMKNWTITSSFYLINGCATMNSTFVPFKIWMCTQQFCSIKILMKFKETLLSRVVFYEFETTPTTKTTELHSINPYLSTHHNED